MNESRNLDALRKASIRAALMSLAGIAVLIGTIIYSSLEMQVGRREVGEEKSKLESLKLQMATLQNQFDQIKAEKASTEKDLRQAELTLKDRKKDLSDVESKINVLRSALVTIGSERGCGTFAQTAFKSAVESSPKTAEILPRVYVQIFNEAQRPEAKLIADKLSSTGFIVPGIEDVGKKAPRKTQLRYFKDLEQGQTKKDVADIMNTLTAAGIEATAVPISGYQTSTKIRQRHYELWFGAT